MRRLVLLFASAVLATGCAAWAEGEDPSASRHHPTANGPPAEPIVTPSAPGRDTSADEPATRPTPTSRETPSTAAQPPSSPRATPARPAWLGARELPRRADGYGQVRPTPRELVDRRLPPPASDLPPSKDDAFAATIQPVPDAVAARSTWRSECPVPLDELRYATVTFWGFDDRPHTGELLVHASAAEELVSVFRRLHEARFPIEEMRVVDLPELDAAPTGDGNNTTAFVCRPAVGRSSWSEHARGLAVDVNPFHNPYARGDLVLPELASAYVDRDDHRPGMIQPGDVVTEAFSAIGWSWGGQWRSTKDWMHFSVSGR